eukprot:CAMPEP_0206273874 /NCGR_PEP_ID=MMETSP0047_2-20121206/34845_1 /ASSEMBLY_ACC=CAM_ASM_000192 /TAXON_ID=195065 /ORGANISM="Chroomonas mesostigmatica_cf, Strain CCMP1168" /LENGTH=44 /DNA_ID= /DNA_START= /DNA_END= /DNA_ORIENTATION=
MAKETAASAWGAAPPPRRPTPACELGTPQRAEQGGRFRSDITME